MAVATRRKRIRVTRKDIEAAREGLASQPKPARRQAEREGPKYRKDSWYGLVCCDAYGHSWINDLVDGEAKSVYLGKTEEFIPYLKDRDIDGENVLRVLNALQQFRSEMDSHSCHLATKTDDTLVSTRGQNPIVANLKDNPQFLRLLERLVAQDKGIRVIHSELADSGYSVPLRTVGRWVKEIKDYEHRD